MVMLSFIWIIVAILALAVVGGTVFASGMLNGNLIEEPDDEIVLQTNKEPKLKKVETENGEIVYDEENGEVVSATSEPKLVPADESEGEPNQQKLPRIEKKTNEKSTNSEIVVDATENSTNGPLLKEIEFNADFESNPVEGEVSLNFGKRTHPITNEVKEHNGIDIKAPEGTNVVSSINGTVNKYTEAGRALIHDSIRCVDMDILHYIMRNPIIGQSVEYNDNRISKYVAQKGRCAVSGIELDVSNYEEKQEHYSKLLENLKIEKEKYLDEIIDRQNWINRLLKYEKSDHLTREMVEVFIERINLFSATKIEICYKFSDIFEDVMSNGGVYIG